MKLDNYNVQNLDSKDLIRISGGGESYAAFFGNFLRRVILVSSGWGVPLELAIETHQAGSGN
ncbi:hypothetical protein [uncultured Tenacibaculum sp.]|uniref:hypothetical protein n=1 Tax=uncultured Tenacibaculum sp. TaxID=174713 RepID=UPI002615BBE5|nr:hypothetical protein [uncultured Tenacibaculum sp.]